MVELNGASFSVQGDAVSEADSLPVEGSSVQAKGTQDGY
jgi:hypothetical protein